MGSRYINDFNRFGRTWQVIVQADTRYRDQVEDVKACGRVRNPAGQMVPLGTLASVSTVGGPLVLTRLQHVSRGRNQWQHCSRF